jgi:hypothetical protein
MHTSRNQISIPFIQRNANFLSIRDRERLMRRFPSYFGISSIFWAGQCGTKCRNDFNPYSTAWTAKTNSSLWSLPSQHSDVYRQLTHEQPAYILKYRNQQPLKIHDFAPVATHLPSHSLILSLSFSPSLIYTREMIYVQDVFGRVYNSNRLVICLNSCTSETSHVVI